jgi:hypothetical protein
MQLVEPFVEKRGNLLIDAPVIPQKLAPQAARYQMWLICPRRLAKLNGKESRILLAY